MTTQAPAAHAPPPAGRGHHGPTKPLSYWWARAAWATPAGVVFGFVLVVILRAAFGFEPLWEPEVYATSVGIFSVLFFLGGIGCFDYWWQWARGKRVDPEDHSLHGAYS